ncbi:MAG: AAA family ATPase [Akkermansiaceae bacterium]|nr:AAA family ATPase [Akkermansiaceae bacterium]
MTAPQRDWWRTSVTREQVLNAIAQIQTQDRAATLSAHGYREARDYVVVYENEEYPSKALYGIAYDLAHPGEVQLSRRGLSGGKEVIRRLSDLGFEIRDISDDDDAAVAKKKIRVWLVRAGRDGEYEQLALAESVAVIGWNEIGPLPEDCYRDQLKGMIQEIWGEQRPQSLASQAGQIFRFRREINVGDLIVLPLKSRTSYVAIGRVTGLYEYRDTGAFADEAAAKHTLPVEWLATDIPYERFDTDLRASFGQQATVSEVTKTDAAQRILDVIGGVDASALDLVLKWSFSLAPQTIERHREVAEKEGAVWWGRRSKAADSTGLASEWVVKLEDQLERGSDTFVYLYSRDGGTWRTRLLDLTSDRSDVDESLVPDYYDPEMPHSLWVKLADFQAIEPSLLTENYVLARSGEPVTMGGLGNQTPLIIRKQADSGVTRYFILNQGQVDPDGGHTYDDVEGQKYHWTSTSSGSWRVLSRSPGARFVYYRTGGATDGTSRSYFGYGRIASIEDSEAGGFIATIGDFTRFETPVPFSNGPSRNAQTSIQEISHNEFESLVRVGMKGAPIGLLNVESLRDATQRAGITLDDRIYVQVLAALLSGKHVILTGPPGTAKTSLAQAVASVAAEAGMCAGFLPTTATADWTTYETIGGLRPTGPDQLEFEEGHFLKAIRRNEWLLIDELNRAHFDRAFGQLFTVLSGQPVVLPYSRPEAGGKPLVLLPEGATAPTLDGDLLEIPQTWRIIATMNVFDKSLLFEMSFALMRRFAFIEVASPSNAIFEALIDREALAEARPADLTKRLLSLRRLKDLGPAVFMDLAKYMRQRIVLDDAPDGQLIFEGFYSYLLPQFEGVEASSGEALFDMLSPMVGTTELKQRLRRTLNAVLGLELSEPSGKASAAGPPESAEEEEQFEEQDL